MSPTRARRTGGAREALLVIDVQVGPFGKDTPRHGHNWLWQNMVHPERQITVVSARSVLARL